MENSHERLESAVARSIHPTLTMHPWHDLEPGKNVPQEFDVVIEIPLGSNVKYELDKNSGTLCMDRVLYSAVCYPANYGFIPRTFADDLDPLEVLVLCQESVAPLTIVHARAMGLMDVTDAEVEDYKIIAVATADPEYSQYRQVSELPKKKLNLVRRLFQDYKQHEIASAEDAYPVIQLSLNRYQETYVVPVRLRVA